MSPRFHKAVVYAALAALCPAGESSAGVRIRTAVPVRLAPGALGAAAAGTLGRPGILPALRTGLPGARIPSLAAVSATIPQTSLFLPAPALISPHAAFEAAAGEAGRPVAAAGAVLPARRAAIAAGSPNSPENENRTKMLSHPALAAAAKPSAAFSGRLFDGVLGRPGAREVSGAAGADEGAAFAGAWSPEGRKSRPAVAGVEFADAVPAAQRELFWETLRRRKAGWYRGISAAGINLLGPRAPTFSVKSAESVSRGTALAFTVDWEQGPTRLGSFRAVIQLKDLEPSIRRGPAPAAPEEKQLRVRFRKTVPAADGSERPVTEREIADFLESRRLRPLGRDWRGPYTAAVTGEDRARDAARALSEAEIVLYATPVALTIPESRRLTVIFKAKSAQGGTEAKPVGEGPIAELLHAERLTVLAVDQDGAYQVAVPPRGSARAAAARLTGRGIVLYAAPKLYAPEEGREAIVSLVKPGLDGYRAVEAVTDDEAGEFFRSRGLRVLEALGERSYRVLGPGRVSGAELAAALAGTPLLGSAIAVGSLGEAELAGAVAGVAAYKGRPWSSTEYNLNYHMAKVSLARRGASLAQLKAFDERSAAAPMRGGGFNPWSGD